MSIPEIISEKSPENEIGKQALHEVARWIAIQPPGKGVVECQTISCNVPFIFKAVPSQYSTLPPSFQDAQFDIILRRQRLRPKEGGGSKFDALPSRFLNLTNKFEFAGWGTLTHLRLVQEDRDSGEAKLKDIRCQSLLGQFTASALAGNAVLGSVFYALPAVVAVSSV